MKQQTSSISAPISRPLKGGLDTATLELLKSWRLEDATDDPEEVRVAEQELAEFKKTMNEIRNAGGELLLYP